MLVTAVVAALFIGSIAALDLAAIVAPVFVVAILALLGGLPLFLLAVQIAIRQNPRRYS